MPQSLLPPYRSHIPADFGHISYDIHGMVLRFGAFELDEETRSLELRGRPVEVQPRVLELLAYLVRNAGRVVPKAELMDALWPDLHVTEASLQRAVSLARRALKEGGMEGAIRNHIRFGYRFGLPPKMAEPDPGGNATDSRYNFIEEARSAATARRWPEAARNFDAASRNGPLSARDLGLWATSLECQGKSREAIPVLCRAVETQVIEDDPGRAAVLAVTLARIHFEAGSVSAAHGWLDRARELTGDSSCEAAGLLLWMDSRIAAFEGRPDEALELVADAFAIAEDCDLAGLKALTLSYLGFYNLSLGRAKEGRQQQDHAAAMALSGGVDPITGSLIYCNILWACRAAVDWSRAAQWNAGFEAWCQVSYADLTGSCELHRADILALSGNLDEALQRVEAAFSKLPENEFWALGEAYRVRGQIHAMMGARELARQDLENARAAGWENEPGHALQLWEDGDPTDAIAALDAALSHKGWFSLQRRPWLIANKAWIAAKAGFTAIAREAIGDLEERTSDILMPAVRAMIAEARASLALCAEDSDEALRMLILARQIWSSLRADFHSARVRLTIAEQLARRDDLTGAMAEAKAAAIEAERCGAIKLTRDAIDWLEGAPTFRS